SLSIDNKDESRRLLDRQFGGLGTPENLVDEPGEALVLLVGRMSERRQSAGGDNVATSGDDRQRVPRSSSDQRTGISSKERLLWHKQSLGSAAGGLGNRGLEFCLSCDFKEERLNAEGSARLLKVAAPASIVRVIRGLQH